VSDEELTPSERAAVLTRLLALGWKPTTMEVAVRFGVHRTTALNTLNKLSRVMPLVQMDDYRWVMFINGDEW
jgi:Mn-dependent DtxR family transcriptional regulator